MRDPAGLRVAEDTARNGKDEAIAFAVALNRAASGTVTVDYATLDEGIEPPLSEAAEEFVGPLRGVGEPAGFRRADGGLVRHRDVRGDHNGAPLRPEHTVAGVRGLRSVRPPFRQRAREAGDSKGGAASLASGQYGGTV